MSRFEEARNVDIYDLIRSLGIEHIRVNNTTFYRCVNPLHEDRHPSMSIKNNRFKCFACGLSGSTIDLVKHHLNVNDIVAVNYILSSRSFPINHKIECFNEAYENQERESEKIKSSILRNSKENTEIIKEYFLLRGLKDIYKDLDKHQLQILSNSYKGKESIIYNFPKRNFMIQKAVTHKKVFVHGHSTFTTYKGYNHNRYAIVEGIEDGLSAFSLGYNFISLNSVSNLNQLIEAMEKHKEKIKENTYYIALDNDLMGIKANKTLKTFLIDNGFNYSCDLFMLYYKNKVKDLNDYIKIFNRGE